MNKSTPACTFAEGCPANTIAVDQTRQYNELSGKMEGVLQGMLPIQKAMTSLEIAVGKFEHLPTIFAEFRTEIKDAVKEYSERLRIIELRKAKDEVNEENIKKRTRMRSTN